MSSQSDLTRNHSMKTKMNEVPRQLKHHLKYAIGVLLVCAAPLVMAATPLNDQELDKNYLKGESVSAKSLQSFQKMLNLNDIKQLLVTFIPLDEVSSLFFVLNSQENKSLLSNINPYMSSNSFGEVATYNFGTEFYSYRWAGNYDDIFDLASVQHYYYNGVTGSVELDSNIKGNVDIEATLFTGDKGTTLFRTHYVF